VTDSQIHGMGNPRSKGSIKESELNGMNTIWGQIKFITKWVSIKQWEELQSTSPVEVKEGQDRKETGINRESGSERAAALSQTMRHHVPPELV